MLTFVITVLIIGTILFILDAIIDLFILIKDACMELIGEFEMVIIKIDLFWHEYQRARAEYEDNLKKPKPPKAGLP